ncbi:TetR/AcrR family transcriptional regulator [Xanthobacter sediminis]|uniref:TetR/AcrR family transcriptional regulator n=1 Tax=Xanthobacter sediminis TaxID=3119926 RepID=UPI00372C8C65
MSEERRAAAGADHTLNALCGRIYERHRDTIKVQKPHVAVANLARIVEAVLTLSNRQGFHATTLRDLSRAAGISMGGLYSYFDGKDTLLLMILEQVADAVTEALGAVPAEVRADPARHLSWLIATHVSLSEAMQPWFVFAYMEAKAFPAPARKAAVESELATERMFAQVLEDGVRTGCFAVADTGFTATLIKPLLQDWYVKRGKYRKRGVNAATYAARVSDFVLAALAPRSVAPRAKAPGRRSPPSAADATGEAAPAVPQAGEAPKPARRRRTAAQGSKAPAGG